MRNALVIVTLLFVTTLAFAHPVDQEQYRYKHLGLKNQAFFDCHASYWHCRRDLNAQIREYSECVGSVRELYDILKWPGPNVSDEFLNYWNVVPAHPVVDKPLDMANCQANIAACQATFRPELVSACWATRDLIRAIYFP